MLEHMCERDVICNRIMFDFANLDASPSLCRRHIPYYQ